MNVERKTQAARSAATRDALISAARVLFAEHGYAEVGTEQIVRAAGVTRGALYHHFPDKQALFAAVFEALEIDVAARIAAAAGAETDPDPIAIMRAGVAAWLDACAEPEVHRIMLTDAPAVLGWERWVAISNQHNMGLAQALLEAAMEVGRIPRQPVAPLAHTVIGAVREAAMYLARADDQRRARAEIGYVMDQLLRGLTAEDVNPPSPAGRARSRRRDEPSARGRRRP
jgi:AcrR family transcriptional regulator